MSRRRRKQPVGLLTAVFVELGTMIGIIAIAQPTWTRSIIESVGKSASSQVVSSQVANSKPFIAQVHVGYGATRGSFQSGDPQLVMPPQLGSLDTQRGNSTYSSYGNNF